MCGCPDTERVPWNFETCKGHVQDMQKTCTHVSCLLYTRNMVSSTSRRVRACASASGLLLGCAAYIKQLSGFNHNYQSHSNCETTWACNCYLNCQLTNLIGFSISFLVYLNASLFVCLFLLACFCLLLTRSVFLTWHPERQVVIIGGDTPTNLGTYYQFISKEHY